MDHLQTSAEFQTTRWSLVRHADDRTCLEELLTLYSGPIYSYFRRRGHQRQDASDLTQGFIADVMLGRGIHVSSDGKRGRFRSYLRAALRNYRIDAFRATRSRTDMGRAAMESGELREPEDGVSPEDAFDREWATVVLKRAADATERACVANNQERHWELFHRRIFLPTFSPSRPSVSGLVGDTDVEPSQASSMIQTVKRRFQYEIRSIVRETVGGEDELVNEANFLVAALTR